ncbi:MAG: carboxypeptidase-like regulatory domain-containing protein, partial [Bacteroidetes bacterium]
MNPRAIIISFFMVSFLAYGFANNPTQKIYGTVLDKDTKEPLIGATVAIVGSNPMIGTTTDIDGNFELDVTVGRVQLECSYIGYSNYLSDPFLLNSARAAEVSIELIESVVVAQEVVVKAKKFGNEPLNEVSILSARSFSVEETQRYAASANDPGRMVPGFPGVQHSRDNRSDI